MGNVHFKSAISSAMLFVPFAVAVLFSNIVGYLYFNLIVALLAAVLGPGSSETWFLVLLFMFIYVSFNSSFIFKVANWCANLAERYPRLFRMHWPLRWFVTKKRGILSALLGGMLLPLALFWPLSIAVAIVLFLPCYAFYVVNMIKAEYPRIREKSILELASTVILAATVYSRFFPGIN